MLAAVRSIDGFDRRRPFRPWLHRIVVNRSLDWLRARARGRRSSVEVAGEVAARPAAGVGLALRRADARARRARPDERALIVMRHLLGYRSAELARMLDLPAGTVQDAARARTHAPARAARG